VAATKRAPLAERKQQRKDEAEEGAEAEEEQPPAKKKKVEVLVMGDKQKALRTVAVGNLSAETLEQGLEFAASVGQVRHSRSTVHMSFRWMWAHSSCLDSVSKLVPGSAPC